MNFVNFVFGLRRQLLTRVRLENGALVFPLSLGRRAHQISVWVLVRTHPLAAQTHCAERLSSSLGTHPAVLDPQLEESHCSLGRQVDQLIQWR